MALNNFKFSTLEYLETLHNHYEEFHVEENMLNSNKKNPDTDIDKNQDLSVSSQ